MKRFLSILAVGLACLAAALFPRPRAEARKPDAPPAPGHAVLAPVARPGEVPRFAAQGVSTCTSMGCHNGGDLVVKKGSEYSVWVTSDPHTRAYKVLLEARSVRIQESLVETGLAPTGQKAEENPLCLKCHGLGGVGCEPSDPRRRQALSSEGVSCEGCHGPSEKWKAVHYRDDWKALTVEQKSALGYINLRDPVVRAWTCAECHLGSPNQEVDHELVAAGHPVLKFEFAAYHGGYPKHWFEPTAGPNFDSRLWSVGQVATAEASLRLLAHRAEGKRVQLYDGAKPAGTRPGAWPELAEYNCFSCHHDLQPESFRQTKGYLKGRKPGSIPWMEWYRWGVSGDPGGALGGVPPEVSGPLAELASVMKVSAPDQATVAALARRTGLGLRAWGERVKCEAFSDTRVRVALGGLDGLSLEGEGWDRSTQLFLALSAFNRSQPDPGRTDRLKALREKLAFPRGSDSPGEPKP